MAASTRFELTRGDVVVVTAGEVIPGDGTVIEGIASVDESAITGESAPVIREAGGDRSAVTGGTRVLSDQIVVEITRSRQELPGQHDSPRRRRGTAQDPERGRPQHLLAGLTIVFLAAVVTLRPFAEYAGTEASIATLIALLVALIRPRSAHSVGDRDRRHGPALRSNVLALSGRAVEAPETLSPATRQDRNHHPRQPSGFAFVPMSGVDERELADVAQIASLADETPEGRSIVVLAKTTGSANATSTQARVRPLHRGDSHERRRHNGRAFEGRG